MTIRHGGLLDRPPRLGRTQAPARLAGEAQAEGCAKAELVEEGPHLLRREGQRDLGDPDIGRFLDHLGNRQHAVLVRIGDRGVADGHASGRGIDHRIEAVPALLEAQCRCKGLHRGTRLIGVGEGAIAKLRAGESLAVVGIEHRVVDQREHFAGTRIEHHRTGRLGLVFPDHVAKRRIGQVLDLAVDRERDVTTLLRQADRLHVLDDVTAAVLDHAP